MTPLRYLLFFCGQVGMMSLARFLYGWILKYGDWDLDGSEEKLFAPVVIGIVYLAFRIFDGITDPLAGNLSDSWVRSGRQRRTLLWFSFAIAPIGLAITFIPNHSTPPALAWGLLSLGLFLFFIGYTFYAIPYWSLVDDYAQGDLNVRGKLSNLLGGGIVVASGIGFVVSGILIEQFGFTTAALCFGSVSIVLMALPFFAAPPPSKSPSKLDSSSTPASLWSGMAGALRHRRFLALLALFGGSQMSFTIMTAAAPYIAIDLLGGSETDVALLLGPLLGVAVPFFLIVPWVSRKHGWLRGMLFASIALALVYAASGLVGQGLIGSPIVTAAIVFGFGGPMIAILLGLEAEGVVDCANERGGRQMVGVYWGVFNFVVKILNGFAFLFAAILAGQKDNWGAIAIRSMSFVAGGCLLIGVLLYFVIRPHKANATK